MDSSQFTVAEPIQLAEDLWDSISEAPELLSLTDAQRRELDDKVPARVLNGELQMAAVRM